MYLLIGLCIYDFLLTSNNCYTNQTSKEITRPSSSSKVLRLYVVAVILKRPSPAIGDRVARSKFVHRVTYYYYEEEGNREKERERKRKCGRKPPIAFGGHTKRPQPTYRYVMPIARRRSRVYRSLST